MRRVKERRTETAKTVPMASWGVTGEAATVEAFCQSRVPAMKKRARSAVVLVCDAPKVVEDLFAGRDVGGG